MQVKEEREKDRPPKFVSRGYIERHIRGRLKITEKQEEVAKSPDGPTAVDETKRQGADLAKIYARRPKVCSSSPRQFELPKTRERVKI